MSTGIFSFALAFGTACPGPTIRCFRGSASQSRRGSTESLDRRRVFQRQAGRKRFLL